MSNPVPALTEDDFAALTSYEATILQHRAATLQLAVGRLGHLEGEPEQLMYVMDGPAGALWLVAVGTDLDRLNAHWTTFAAHPLNATAAVAA